jgi:hypothetical protein
MNAVFRHHDYHVKEILRRTFASILWSAFLYQILERLNKHDECHEKNNNEAERDPEVISLWNLPI